MALLMHFHPTHICSSPSCRASTSAMAGPSKMYIGSSRPSLSHFRKQNRVFSFVTRPFSAFVVRAATLEDSNVEEDAMERMDKSLESMKLKFATVRTGRAAPSMLDRIQVDYYGAPTPLKALAGISAPESSVLVIQPFDKSAMAAIEKAIMLSDLGVTPSNDGNIIRINIPQLTSERRKEMSKLAAKLGEEGKVAIRNVRRDAKKAIDKLEASEDGKKDLESAVQKLTDEYIKEVDTLVKNKQDELTNI